jgi:hypothetical protein
VLLAVVEKHHPLVDLDHQDLLVGFCWALSDGAWIWCLDGWVMQLMDENIRWEVGSIGAKFREHIYSHIVVANHMMNF